MTKRFSFVIAWGCVATLLAVPAITIFLFFRIDVLSTLASQAIPFPIQWTGVTTGQWYGFWLLTVLYVTPGLLGLYYLRRAFANFAKGELFTASNSQDLRRFAILLFIQAIAGPVHLALSSVLLSLHHPAGQKMLTIMIGSNEIKVIALAMMLWVLSDLLVKASELEHENRQFV